MRKNLMLWGVSASLLLYSCKKAEMALPLVPSSSEADPTLSAKINYKKIRTCSAPTRGGTGTSAVGKTASFWPNNPNGRTVFRIKFLRGGSEFVRSKIQHYAKYWEQYANVRFDFIDSNQPAEIRIAISDDGGSWSYVGTDNLSVSAGEQTMNYGWFTDTTDDTEFERVVVHEFGHMLGLEHEQSHPQINIQWNKPVVYNYYKRTNGWNKRAVDENVFAKFPTDGFTFSPYDPTSIMHYPVPKEFTLNGMSIGFNTELSPTDKSFIQKIYPFSKTTDPTNPSNPVMEKILYTIEGFKAYMNNASVTNKVYVKSNTEGDILLEEALRGYPVDFYWKNDRYAVVDTSGRSYAFTSQTIFNDKVKTNLKGSIKVFKNNQEVFSN